MSILPTGPQRFPTVQEVDTWLLAAQERRAQLHCHAASPLESDERQEAFTAKPRQNSLYEIGEISRPCGIGVSHYR